jgi:hypothetical protein
MQKLEKDYTREELKVFFREALKNNIPIRKTADGGWEMYERVPAVTEAPEPVVQEQPKMGFWKRLKNRFKEKV